MVHIARISKNNIVKEVELIKILCGRGKKRFSAFKKSIGKINAEEEKINSRSNRLAFRTIRLKQESNPEDFEIKFLS